MKIDYHKYNFEDFARDESFRQWIIYRDSQAEAFWLEWMIENPGFESKINLARAFLYALEEKDTSLGNSELDAVADEIILEHKPKRIPFLKSSIFRWAASVFLIAGMGVTAFYFFKPLTDKSLSTLEKISPVLIENYIEKTNNSDKTQEIKLEDGSNITLYPKSKIRYPKVFTLKKREVYLAGQAFFNIAKNPKRPFWVYTSHISTQVLGTSFMIKANENAKDVKVEVKTGKVSVYTLKDLEERHEKQQVELAGIILTPNQQASYSKNDDRLIKSIVDHPDKLNSAPAEELHFSETRISKVFDQLERTYGLTIIYDSNNMKDCFLTANFENESLFEKLNLICKVTHSSYEISDAQIIIHSNGCE